MVNDDELLLKLRRQIHRRGHDHEEGAGVFAGENLTCKSLDDLGAAQISVQVLKHDDGGGSPV